MAEKAAAETIPLIAFERGRSASKPFRDARGIERISAYMWNGPFLSQGSLRSCAGEKVSSVGRSLDAAIGKLAAALE
jgi:hypothetical protein